LSDFVPKQAIEPSKDALVRLPAGIMQGLKRIVVQRLHLPPGLQSKIE
jgi:hypothetical protein